MILDDKIIETFIEEMKAKKAKTEIIYFKCKDGKYMKIHGYGVAGVVQDEEFFENLHDHLIYSELSWIQPIIDVFKCPIEAEADVDNSGSVGNEKIKIEARIQIPKEASRNLPGYLYPRFQSIIRLHSFIQDVKVDGYDGCLSALLFTLQIDAKKVNKVLSSSANGNKQLTNQWITTIEKYRMFNIGAERFSTIYQVINGKLDKERKRDLYSAYIDLSKKIE
ncbi:hypothetical protein [Bacillus sp. AFS040349]|uniref:hypothetical protein n=1 Tax=Bacillus sp. AFS040349 TaxID=2033502 RepID=UPI000BFC9A4B|nr:hypothetical protein [Bacillus sp. AFS040349]PGT83268.1 hypothetical protein COD11_13110 [Bacillus sp. AFS040349]